LYNLLPAVCIWFRFDKRMLCRILCSIGAIGQGLILNFPTLPDPEFNFFGTGWIWKIKTQDVSLILAFLDIVVSSVYIYATWSLRLVQSKVIEALDEDTISAADYTVRVEGIHICTHTHTCTHIHTCMSTHTHTHTHTHAHRDPPRCH